MENLASIRSAQNFGCLGNILNGSRTVDSLHLAEHRPVQLVGRLCFDGEQQQCSFGYPNDQLASLVRDSGLLRHMPGRSAITSDPADLGGRQAIRAYFEDGTLSCMGDRRF